MTDSLLNSNVSSTFSLVAYDVTKRPVIMKVLARFNSPTTLRKMQLTVFITTEAIRRLRGGTLPEDMPSLFILNPLSVGELKTKRRGPGLAVNDSQVVTLPNLHGDIKRDAVTLLDFLDECGYLNSLGIQSDSFNRMQAVHLAAY